MDDRRVWHEDEEFWTTFEEYLFPPEKLEEASGQVDRLLEILDLPDGAAVLDVPCGVGRHAVELARRGFRVTGVDATASYLETARERAGQAGVRDESDGGNVEFVRGDMRRFRRPEAFDAVVNLFTSFGYFEARTDDERVARNFYESLRQGGLLVMDLTSTEVLAREFVPRTWTERDGAYFLEERAVRDDWTRVESRWIAATDEGLREFTVSHRLYTASELSALLEDVGFDEVSVYGDFERSDYDEDADRLVVVARA